MVLMYFAEMFRITEWMTLDTLRCITKFVSVKFTWLLYESIFCLGCGLDEESYKEEERLNVLHSQIQQEADKIRKWKNTMELDMQQKERKLKESQLMVDRQRKELTETQVNIVLMCRCYVLFVIIVVVNYFVSIVISCASFKVIFMEDVGNEADLSIIVCFKPTLQLLNQSLETKLQDELANQAEIQRK